MTIRSPSPAQARPVALVLLALVCLVALLSPWLGVPVVGALAGRDADFALSTLAQLNAAIGEGRWWPRWLMTANDGLGGTVFYSYPPLAYWVAALVQRGLGLGVPDGLAVTVALWRVLAVATAWVWLRRHVGPWPALAGAALGALLPYVALVNPWVRFAYSETAAAALLPLLLLALERCAEGKGGQGLPGLALAYAALALTNLPTCALAAHFGPLYAWGYGGWCAAWRSLGGGLIGAALAGCFLLPAFGLLPAANGATLFNPSWRENLMFFAPPTKRLLVIWASAWATLAVGLAAVWIAHPQPMLRPGWPRALLLLLVGSFLAMTVLALPFWLVLPQLGAVEHPWRASAFLTLGAAGLAALAARSAVARWPLALAGASLTAAVPVFLALLSQLGQSGWPRFLPADQRMAFMAGYSGSASAEHIPAAAAAAGWDRVTAGAPPPHPRPLVPAGTILLPDGFRIPNAVAPFTLPQFYFPAWTASDASGAVPLRASPDGFVEVLVRPPAHDVQVRIGTTPWESAGWAVTLLAAVVVVVVVSCHRLGSIFAARRFRTELERRGS